MAQTNPRNLWPEDLVGKPDETGIVAILRQQAVMLSQLTKDVLKGEVISEAFEGGIVSVRLPTEALKRFGIEAPQTLPNNITNIFYIKVPSIEYRYKLFYIHHAIEPEYPARIVNPSELSPPTGKNIAVVGSNSNLPGTIVHNETQLYEKLQEIFNSDRTKKVIRSLIAQSVS
ncbi:hypothetical protein TUMEXPCC7403_00870 [Tumidithrix helvetica PCC 7403]|uniref:hypothetical protein n=1 Tax=Tumidithrix helvetica TaxID=3457545 RepID=UPI003CBA5C75